MVNNVLNNMQLALQTNHESCGVMWLFSFNGLIKQGCDKQSNLRDLKYEIIAAYSVVHKSSSSINVGLVMSNIAPQITIEMYPKKAVQKKNIS